MQRVAFMGACLFAVGACAGEGAPSDPASDSGRVERGGDVRVLDRDEIDALRDPTAGRLGPLPDGEAASCVESYAPQALSRRAFAFDGVVVEVGPPVSDRGDEADLDLPGVTFAVREWFSGSAVDTITVDMQSLTAGDVGPSDPAHAYGIGSRLLVSGEARWGGSSQEDLIAWGCGFSRYYDPDTAAAWREALSR